MRERYHDIIDLPHHVSATHPQMARLDRAAQFAPFAALTGYEAAVEEMARLTDRHIELDESAKAALDERLQFLQGHIGDETEVTITYFMPDKKKVDGAYIEASGTVKKIDGYERALIMCDGTKIPIDEILQIEGNLFRFLDPFA